MNKRETHIVTGMTKDLAVSRFEPTYVYDARNIRIRTVGDNSTMLSVTNEKGTKEFEITSGPTVEGTILGTASFSDTLVLFTKDNTTEIEYIYKILFHEDFSSAVSTLLFEGEEPNILNWEYDHPLETLALFENESIKKVYWVDGVNQPRVINIAANDVYTNPDIFNFNREIGADAKIEVTKFNSGGEFRPGTIQYCFNYFNKFGQETNIVDVSPLYYISPKDSGLAADAVSSCSFQITFEGLNRDFEYIRLYAIYRSSENATPNVRIVGDYKVADFQSKIYSFEPFAIVNTPIEAPNVEVPFSNLWIIDSAHTIIGNIYEMFGPEGGSSTHTITLNENEYLYDDRNDAVYCEYYLDRSGEITFKKNTVNILHHGGTSSYWIVKVYDVLEHRALAYSTFIESEKYKETVIIDTGVYGSTIDASALLFLGGQYIIAKTIAEKDNTLFLGNIQNKVPLIGDLEIPIQGDNVSLKNLHNDLTAINVKSCAFDFSGSYINTFSPDKEIPIDDDYEVSIYQKDNNRTSAAVKTFKARENYRLGFIAQYKTGQWSEAVWLGDFTENEQSGINHFFPSSEYEMDGSTYNLTLWGQQFRSAGFLAEFSSSIANVLLGNGFIKIAPVVVYPQLSDRLVICQGLLCPSIFNVSDRIENAPFAQCDWRFRKGYSWERIVDEIQINATNSLDDINITVGKILSGYSPKVPFAHYSEDEGVSYTNVDSVVFNKYFGTEYYTDPSILTFHSPELDSSEELLKDDISSLNLRLVGYSNGGFSTKLPTHTEPYVFNTESNEIKSAVHYYIEMQTSGWGKDSELLIGNTTKKLPSTFFEYYTRIREGGIQKYFYTERFGGPLKINGFKDKDYTNAEETSYESWITYLWHRNGSLNSQESVSGEDGNTVRTAVYNRKITSEKSWGYTTYFKNPNAEFADPFTLNVPVESISLYDSDSFIVKGSAPFKKDTIFQGSSTKALINPLWDASNLVFYDDYDLEGESNARNGDDLSQGYAIRNAGAYQQADEQLGMSEDSLFFYGDSARGKDGLEIKYLTTRHGIISLKPIDNSTVLQLGIPQTNTNSHYMFWLNDSKYIEGVSLPEGFYEESSSQHINYSFLKDCIYIGELYRDMSPEQFASRFGGSTQEALTANTWTLAGDAVKLEPDSSITLYYKEGDTYFGRYDCLKSYPVSPNDKQSIVSIYSTELESRVNLDFRYGNTMDLDDNTMVTPQNFNLYNHPGYEQTNQYFTYKSIDYDRYSSVDDFPNMITWSLEKTLGEDVDTWTSIPMTSTLDLDGTKGEITKLARFNNEIFAFQENAFAQILFNSRVQIPVSDGVPVEITNGYKVDGKRYISESIGMQNKWSLGITPYSMYFADDHKNSIYAYNGQLTDLTVAKGMKTWMSGRGDNLQPVWNPVDYGNIRTFYDRIYGEVYFTTKDNSLVYSEPIGNFISFMDYGSLPAMGNMGNKYFAFTEDSKMHEMWAGDYNSFFGEYKPYSLTFISNSDPTVDKVFNNLEWRSTMYNGLEFRHSDTFDTLRVWNEHQDTGNTQLIYNKGIPSFLKKKFNAFRAFVPRDMESPMNRIRNPWAYIKLSKETENTYKFMFTDFNVDFFE